MVIMHTITLHRVRKGQGTRYRIDEVFRMHTSDDLCVPTDLKLDGVHLGESYLGWFENKIASVIERHMGDRMIDKWALEDGDHKTIAVCVDDYLVCPDLLMNTTSYMVPPSKHKSIVHAVKEAIEKREPSRCIKPLVFCPKWELEWYSKYIKDTYIDKK